MTPRRACRHRGVDVLTTEEKARAVGDCMNESGTT
jgi:hypothetical protein